MPEIALISFAWMCEQIAPYIQLKGGDLLTLAMNTVEDRMSLIRPIMEAVSKGEKDYGSNRIISKGWAALDKIGIHKAQLKKIADGVVDGWATGPIIDSFAGTMMAAGSEIRNPGRYELDTTGKKPIKVGPANEYIHPSVGYRKTKRPQEYNPPALKGFNRIEAGNKGFIWTDGKSTIPEYVIKPEDVFTRYIAQQDSMDIDLTAVDFVGDVDRVLDLKTSERQDREFRLAAKAKVNE